MIMNEECRITCGHLEENRRPSGRHLNQVLFE
jgi:hypothetical protein